MIAGNSFREESICWQILGPLNLIDLFPYHSSVVKCSLLRLSYSRFNP